MSTTTLEVAGTVSLRDDNGNVKDEPSRDLLLGVARG
jgi:hypothetical protein